MVIGGKWSITIYNVGDISKYPDVMNHVIKCLCLNYVYPFILHAFICFATIYKNLTVSVPDISTMVLIISK